ncbi:MAG: orotate phosphoribosyltransferase [Actinomycetota bacterium]|nr:orotate phosphoribosyltransferase [Actinomycetota bacterium]
MTDRDRLLPLIRELAVVRGPVTLSSGQQADFYVDLRRVTLHHAGAPLVGSVMLDTTGGWDYDAVGGLTLGADPVAVAMLHAAAGGGRPLDAFVVRKEGKAHGLQRRIEGPDVAGRRVLAVEDTSTTGASVLAAVDALREAGAEVVGVAVIVDRGAGAAVRAAGLDYRAAYTMAELS